VSSARPFVLGACALQLKLGPLAGRRKEGHMSALRSGIISRTGQMWKLGVGFAVLMASGAGMMYAQSQIHAVSPGQFFFLMMGSVAVGMLAMAFACLFVRCPNCRARWVWTAMRHQKADVWTTWLLTLKSCPTCGTPGPNVSSSMRK
jgi:hypothetical protein